MIDIQQLTNFDIQHCQTITKKVYVGGKSNTEEVTYRIITQSDLGDVAVKIFKLGYCVNDNEGINYPIFLIFEGDTTDDAKIFYIGKTGMYEFQSEDWDDVNDPRPEEDKEDPAIVYVTGLLIPDNVPFVLDYCFNK